MSSATIRIALLGATLAATGLHAQVPQAPAHATGAATPEALATAVMQKFAGGKPDEFTAIFPDSAGRAFMRTPAPKQADLARVVWRGGDRAVLLLAGTTTTGGGGNQTNAARNFSGFYEAARAHGEWRVVRQIPFDTANFIRTQALTADLHPGRRLDVVDTLTITTGAPHGFGFRINNDVKFTTVELDGRPVQYAFGGGVVWLDTPPAAASRLVLRYSLEASGPAAEGPPPAFGAYHNTDIWHPAFDYMSANHLAQLSIVARIPAEYQLTTTLPQTDTVRSGVRTVYGSSAHHDFLLALIFDREWQPRTTDFGTFRFESFTTPAFRHSHDTLAARVKHLYDLLTPRFGEPRAPTRYLAAVEDRALGQRGNFSVAMNAAAVSAGGGGALGSQNGQIFVHEVSHAWTVNASGRAANFLREGWARMVESLVLRDLFGPDAEAGYWEAQRNGYMVGNDRRGWNGGFEGRQSILSDFDNGRIHYTKGSWIYQGGRWALGEDAFQRGMRAFIDGMGREPRGYEELIAAWSAAAGRDMAPFVMPWLTSRHIPDVEARVEGDRLILTQVQPGELFELPNLEVELTTPTGKVLRTLRLRQRADTVALGDIGAVSEIRVDPNHRYLVQRHWGEVVRFELPADRLPGAEAVQLSASFLRQGVALPATKHGDTWVVEVPLSEGRYAFAWSAAGAPAAGATPDPALTGTRSVAPRQRIREAYPGR